MSLLGDLRARRRGRGAQQVEAWEKPFTRGRHMQPADVGMRFEDVYYNRFGIAVSIYDWVHDETSSRGPHHEWLVIDAAGHTSSITNCYVEEPAGPDDRPCYGHFG